MGGGLSHQRIRYSLRHRTTRQSACALAIDVEQSPFAFARAERWPSGRRHQIANLAYWVTGTEGSNPSLSATQHVLFTYRLEMSANSRVGGLIRSAGGTRERDQSCKSPIRDDSSLFRRDSVPRADSFRSCPDVSPVLGRWLFSDQKRRGPGL